MTGQLCFRTDLNSGAFVVVQQVLQPALLRVRGIGQVQEVHAE